jgi:hypothetical protein
VTTTQNATSVGEVPSTGEVHGDPRSPGGLDDDLVADRAPGATTARTPASRRISSPSANGKNASEAATAPAARSAPARDTARRHESTRLTWPMPTPTAAPSSASRIAFDFTARIARQAKARSARVASSAGAPETSRQ